MDTYTKLDMSPRPEAELYTEAGAHLHIQSTQIVAKTPLTPPEYIAQLNEVLQREDKFKPSMRFYLNPNCSSQFASIDLAWFEPFVFLDLAASVQKKVDEKFQIIFPTMN